MIPVLLAAVGTPALAAIVTKTGDICIEISEAFTDLAGVNWTSNSDRPARGVRIFVTDAVETQETYLDDQTGCLDDFAVQVEENNGTLDVQVLTRARVNGVDLSSWRGADTSDKTWQTVTWNNLSTGTGLTFSGTRVISNYDQRWLNLLVGGMVFRSYDWNVLEGNDYECCLEDRDGYSTDGTCTDTDKGYDLVTTPIQMQGDDTVNSGACCGSTIIDTDGIAANDPPGLWTGTAVSWKHAIAHEVGHVIAEMRMGGKEWGQYQPSAADGYCNGDQRNDAGIWVWLDAATERGEFTKETLSLALREGWANFVAAVTWNTRVLDPGFCEFQVVWQRHDFDLDGDVDSNRSTDSLDGAYDCEGYPGITGDPALQSYIISTRDWLEEIENADDGFSAPDPGQCSPDADDDVEGKGADPAV